MGAKSGRLPRKAGYFAGLPRRAHQPCAWKRKEPRLSNESFVRRDVHPGTRGPDILLRQTLWGRSQHGSSERMTIDR